jgi:hypothetical protein
VKAFEVVGEALPKVGEALWRRPCGMWGGPAEGVEALCKVGEALRKLGGGPAGNG